MESLYQDVLKVLHRPKTLYKYRPVDIRGHTNRIITHNELWFDLPRNFNDPFDCKPPADFSGTATDWKKSLKHFYGKLSPQISDEMIGQIYNLIYTFGDGSNRKIEEIFRNNVYKNLQHGIFCLTEDCDNILMWSHYAENHSGICLGFEFDLTNSFYVGGDPIRYTWSVRYPDEYDPPKFHDDDPSEFLVKLLTVKSKIWAYEKEWRILVHGKHGVMGFPDELLSEVIFGLNMGTKIDRIC